MSIRYVVGDATSPLGPGPKVIVHVCNDAGKWGKGFVLAVSKKWPKAEATYRAWYRQEGDSPFELGQVQYVEVGYPDSVAAEASRPFATRPLLRDSPGWRRLPHRRTPPSTCRESAAAWPAANGKTSSL